MEQITLNIDKIIVLKNFNARKDFNKENLEELAESIKNHGIIQPLAVRKDKNKYYLIAGERRIRAARIAGLQEVPCSLFEVSEKEAIEMMNIENLQREDLSPLEQAEGINRLLKLGESPEEVAHKIGVSLSFIYNRNKLNFLIQGWKEVLEYGGIKLHVAEKLSRLPDSMQEAIKASYKENDWNVDVLDGKLYYASDSMLDKIKNVYNDLQYAPFDIKDVSFGCTACIDCIKRSGCNKMLFPELEGKEDICLDLDCYNNKFNLFFERKITELKDKTGIEPVLITESYYSNREGVLSNDNYDIVKKSEDGAIPAIYINGKKVGKTAYIIKVYRNSNSGPITEEQKAERKKVIRENKIVKNQLSLSVSSLADTFQQHFVKTGNVHPEIIDHMIIEKIGFGQSKDFIEYFTQRYSWEQQVDYNDSVNRRKILAENIRSTPVEKKLQLLIDVYFKFTTVSDWDKQAMNLAKSIKEIDFEVITRQATELVDKKKKK